MTTCYTYNHRHPFYKLPIPVQQRPKTAALITVIALAVVARYTRGKKRNVAATTPIKAAPFKEAPKPVKAATKKTNIAAKAFATTVLMTSFARLAFVYATRPPKLAKDQQALLNSIRSNLGAYRKYLSKLPEMHIPSRANSNPERIFQLLNSLKPNRIIKKLDFSYLDSETFPEEFCSLLATKFPALKSLSLEGNNLACIPASIGKFSCLQSLCVSHNSLKTLPKTFKELKQLRDLDLKDNFLSALPEGFETLELSSLNLQRNEFKTLPLIHPNIRNCHICPLNRGFVNIMFDYRQLASKLPGFTGFCSVNAPHKLMDFLATIKISKDTTELSFSYLELGTFPEDFCALLKIKYPNLAYLSLEGNDLQQLPRNLGCLDKLKILNLARNNFKTFEKSCFEGLTSLEVLDLSDNVLKLLLPTVCRSPKLSTLRLSGNPLTQLPEELGHLQQLKNLDLRNCHLTRLSESFQQLRQLETLDVRLNSFTDFAVDTLPSRRCRALVYPGRDFVTHVEQNIGFYQKITKRFFNTQKAYTDATILLERFLYSSREHIKRLNFSDLKLGHVPDQAIEFLASVFPNLECLCLRGNLLEELPPIKEHFPHLKELDLSNNRLETLGPITEHFTNLEVLNLSSNAFSSIPDAVAKCTGLTDLDLSNNRLQTLPESFNQLSSLMKLDLSRNQLQTVDPIASSNLRVLVLDHNCITDLPKDFHTRCNPYSLGLSYNKLIELPQTLFLLKNLQTLDLSSNSIETLPKEISKLQLLETLNLNLNKLSSLPDAFKDLSSLKTLHLAGNKFDVVPQCFEHLKDLRTLYLQNNQLSSFPSDVIKLNQLTTIDLSGNTSLITLNSIDTHMQAVGDLRMEGTPVYYALLIELQQRFHQNLSIFPMASEFEILNKIVMDNPQYKPLFASEEPFNITTLMEPIYNPFEPPAAQATPVTHAASAHEPLPSELALIRTLLHSLNIKDIKIFKDDVRKTMSAFGEKMLQSLTGWQDASSYDKTSFIECIDEIRGYNTFGGFSPFLVYESVKNGEFKIENNSWAGETAPIGTPACPVSLLTQYRNQKKALCGLYATPAMHLNSYGLDKILSRDSYDSTLNWLKLQWNEFKDQSIFFQKRALDALLAKPKEELGEDHQKQVSDLQIHINKNAKKKLEELEKLPQACINKEVEEYMTFLRELCLEELKKQLAGLGASTDSRCLGKQRCLISKMKQLQTLIGGEGGAGK